MTGLASRMLKKSASLEKAEVKVKVEVEAEAERGI